MLSFESDYVEGCHEAILRRFAETNMEKLSGYGTDPYTQSAKEKIRRACECESAEVYFLAGGTQTNQIVIDTLLESHEGVIAAKTGHIACHEAGAIEYTGHKVLELPQTEGKISASDLRDYLQTFWADENRDHLVFPGMVYLSHPTEYGTLYSYAELKQISEVCKAYDIPLYMDGARLGYALASPQSDVSLAHIAQLCDAFYIGGTKVGALCGEALMFPRKSPKCFVTKIKQHGALLAKGRVLGIQFDTLFTDDLYFSLGRHAIDMAEQMKSIFRAAGFRFHLETPTNQVFVVLNQEEKQLLSQELRFSFWEQLDAQNCVVRLATSWATTQEDMDALASVLHKLSVDKAR